MQLVNTTLTEIIIIERKELDPQYLEDLSVCSERDVARKRLCSEFITKICLQYFQKLYMCNVCMFIIRKNGNLTFENFGLVVGVRNYHFFN